MTGDHRSLDLTAFGMDGGYQHLLETSLGVFSADERVGAVLAVGSVGRGQADPSSDLDLLAVAADAAAQQSLIDDWERWLEAITPTVYQRLLHGLVVTAVTDDWLRLDITVAEPDVVPLMTSGPATVLFDHIGVEPPSAPPPETIDADALSEKIENFIRSIGMLATDEVRGEFTVLTWANEFLIQELVDLFFIDAERARRTIKRIHVDLPPRCAEILNDLPRPGPDRQSVLHAHLAVAAEFLPLARRLLEERDGEWPHTLEEATNRHLKHHFGTGLPPSTTN